MKYLASFSKKSVGVAAVTLFAVTFFVSAAVVVAQTAASWQGPTQSPPGGNLPGFIFNGTALQSGANFNVGGQGSVGSLSVQTGDANFNRSIIVADSICFDSSNPANCRDSWNGLGGGGSTTTNNYSADLWSLASNNEDIYYAGGKVGVWTNEPNAAFEAHTGNTGATIGIGGVAIGNGSQTGMTGVMGVAADTVNSFGVTGIVIGDNGARNFGGSLAGTLGDSNQTLRAGVYGYNEGNGEYDKAGFFRGSVHVDGGDLSVYQGKVSAWTDQGGVVLDNGRVCFGGDCNQNGGSGESIFSPRVTGELGQWSLVFATNFENRMIVSGDVANGTAGNVGIGTLSPQSALDIKRDSGLVGIGLASGNARWVMSHGGSTSPFVISLAGGDSLAAQLQAAFGVSSVSQLTVQIIMNRFPDITQAQAQAYLDSIRAYVNNGTSYLTISQNGGVAVGKDSAATSSYSFAAGGGQALTDGATALGRSTANGYGSFSAGGGAGNGTIANGSGSIALGLSSQAKTPGAIAIGGYWGSGTQADGTGSVAIGPMATAEGTRSIAIGDATAKASDAVIAIGGGANAEGVRAIALGGRASNYASTALGYEAVATTDRSVAVGMSQATGRNALAIGTGIGSPSTASGDGSIAINGQATGGGSIAIGANVSGSASYGIWSTVSGNRSMGFGLGIGNGTNVTGYGSIGMGSAQVNADNSLAIGFGIGQGANVMGYNNVLIGVGDVSGRSSMGFGGSSGNGIQINGNNSYAIGSSVTVNADNSFAIGNASISTPNTMAIGYSQINLGGNVTISGNLQVSGTKNFIMDNPENPAQQIVYSSLEGGESGTYTRGSGKLTNGSATITLPSHFSLVTADQGITAQVTPTADVAGLYIASKSNKQIVVREIGGGKSSATFDFIVYGVRKGHENDPVIVDKKSGVTFNGAAGEQLKELTAQELAKSADVNQEIGATPEPIKPSQPVYQPTQDVDLTTVVPLPGNVHQSWWQRIINFFKNLF